MCDSAVGVIAVLGVGVVLGLGVVVLDVVRCVDAVVMHNVLLPVASWSRHDGCADVECLVPAGISGHGLSDNAIASECPEVGVVVRGWVYDGLAAEPYVHVRDLLAVMDVGVVVLSVEWSAVESYCSHFEMSWSIEAYCESSTCDDRMSSGFCGRGWCFGAWMLYVVSVSVGDRACRDHLAVSTE